MYDIGHHERPRPKCYFTHSVLPSFVDHDQPSLRKKPFSTIQKYPFHHTLDLVLPKDSHDAFLRRLGDKGTLRHAKVYLKLQDIVDGEFFNDYIKTGNILLLSQGRTDFDNIFSLREGVLRLELDRATCERTGLNGTAIPSGGRKHVKARYAVEINLRLPSMVRGKHGFERILWAFKNVLNNRLAWLFYDLKGPNDGTGPIATHQPVLRQSEPMVEELGDIVVPSLPTEVGSDDQDTPADMLEWLTLTMSGSPRILQSDSVDDYLSKYRVPESDGQAEACVQTLVKVKWHGLIPQTFVQMVAIAAMKAAGASWFAMRGQTFNGKIHAFLQHNQHTLTWEFED